MSDRAEHNAYAPPGMRDQIAGGQRLRTMLSGTGLMAALATSSCCLLPFIFVSVGISGAWIGNLTILAPYQPIFFGLAAVLIGASFHQVYGRQKVVACAPGSACADPWAERVTKAVLSGAATLAIAGVAVPRIVGLLVQT